MPESSRNEPQASNTPEALIGRYDVLFELAVGGMARVELGRRIGAAGFDRLVVIKRIHSHLLANEGVREMFVDEARLTSNVHHPNVVPIVDVFDAGGELALVMDYVESVSLSALLSAARSHGERLPLDVVSRILGDTLLGLHAAHDAVNAQGEALALVHRDVSPQNVIVGTDGVSRLIDFGIAKAAERIAITKDDALKGKLRYMSPEQGRREPLDRRSDVFAVGLVLYEAIAGRRALDGDDEATVWITLVLGELEPIADLEPAITEVLAHALQRRPDDRLPTARDFEERLRAAIPPATPAVVAACVDRYLGPKITSVRDAIRAARRGPLTSPRRADVTPSTVTEISPSPVHSPRSRRAVFVSLVALAVVGGLAFVATRPPRTTSAHEPAPSAVADVASTMASATAETMSSAVPSASAPPVDTSRRPAPRPAGRPSRKLRDNPYSSGSVR